MTFLLAIEGMFVLATTIPLGAQPLEVRVAPLADAVVGKRASAKHASTQGDGKSLSIGGWSSEVLLGGGLRAECRMQTVSQITYLPDGRSEIVNSSERVCRDVPSGERLVTEAWDRWSFLKFDTSAVGHVSSARLRLFGARRATSDVDVWADIVPASDTTWSEEELNLKFDTDASLDRVKLAKDETERWYEWDVSDWVVREKAAGRHVVTLVVVSDTRLPAVISTDVVASFHSREARTHQPELVLVP